MAPASPAAPCQTGHAVLPHPAFRHRSPQGMRSSVPDASMEPSVRVLLGTAVQPALQGPGLLRPLGLAGGPSPPRALTRSPPRSSPRGPTQRNRRLIGPRDDGPWAGGVRPGLIPVSVTTSSSPQSQSSVRTRSAVPASRRSHSVTHQRTLIGPPPIRCSCRVPVIEGVAGIGEQPPRGS